MTVRIVYDSRYTRWGQWTAIVINPRGSESWYANIYKPLENDPNTIESFIRQGRGEQALHDTLKAFGAGNRLEWSEGQPQ